MRYVTFRTAPLELVPRESLLTGLKGSIGTLIAGDGLFGICVEALLSTVLGEGERDLLLCGKMEFDEPVSLELSDGKEGNDVIE